MHRTLVLDVVGLSADLLGADTPHLSALARKGALRTIDAVTPAVTCSAQATYLTGLPIRDHGIVANGWYFRDLSEVWFWRQSNRLVEGEKLWETARRRDPTFTVAKLFWWYNMYSSVDISMTPRPMYCADGRKLPDVYCHPASLRDELQTELGQFPLFDFWGPRAGIASSRWITDAAKRVEQRFSPTLNLVYLPHLDYNLQRLGPKHPDIAKDLTAVDALCGELLDMAAERDLRVIVLSEYGITEVEDAVHINRVLRENGWVTTRQELGLEQLDPGASLAFAVADHQLAHVYVRDPALVPKVKAALEATEGIERVLGVGGKQALSLDHERSGELIAITTANRWFSYYYWQDDAKAPDFARTVDIHRKPGYDPVELFLDPKLRLPRLTVGSKLARKAMGFRTLLDVIPLDAKLVRGSHGRPTDDPNAGPLLLSSESDLVSQLPSRISSLAVKDAILSHIFD